MSQWSCSVDRIIDQYSLLIDVFRCDSESMPSGLRHLLSAALHNGKSYNGCALQISVAVLVARRTSCAYSILILPLLFSSIFTSVIYLDNWRRYYFAERIKELVTVVVMLMRLCLVIIESQLLRSQHLADSFLQFIWICLVVCLFHFQLSQRKSKMWPQQWLMLPVVSRINAAPRPVMWSMSVFSV